MLGAPYERHTIELDSDDEGPVVATLVRRRAGTPTRRAVLYVHGFNDYFFQTHLADFYVARGWDFYALDLRKCGRSWLPHQTPNFLRHPLEYAPELDEAARLVRDVDGHDTLLVNGHSTGGLLVALWAHERRAAGLVDALFLNSPFFDFRAPWLVRRPVAALLTNGLGRASPYRVVPLGVSLAYGQSLHADHHGEWSFDLAWKPVPGFPIRAGWLHAIRHGHRLLRAGLSIPVPILVARSAATCRGRRWTDAAMRADAVLDVAHMARWAPALGRHVTIVTIEGGLHDLTLSPAPVRQELFSEVDRWLGAYVAGPGGTRPTGPAGAPAGAG